MTTISLDLDALRAECEELNAFLAQPDSYSSPDFTAKNKRFSELETLIAKAAEREQIQRNLTDRKSVV